MGHGEPTLQRPDLEQTVEMLPLFGDEPGSPVERQTVIVRHLRNASGPRAFMHIVMFRMKPTADETVRDEALRLMDVMCNVDGVLSYQLAESDDKRPHKPIGMSEVVVFDSEEAFEAFKQTAAHQKFVDFIQKYADWNVSDYWIPAYFA